MKGLKGEKERKIIINEEDAALLRAHGTTFPITSALLVQQTRSRMPTTHGSKTLNATEQPLHNPQTRLSRNCNVQRNLPGRILRNDITAMKAPFASPGDYG